MSEFQPGDRVQLKTGSPPMTIEKINWQGVSCVWYERGNSSVGLQHTPKRQHFDADTLMPYQRPLTAMYSQQRPHEAFVLG